MAWGEEDEVMRRRAFLSTALAGLAVPPGVLDSAARLEPVFDSGPLARQVAELEATVHRRALDFPTVPTIDQMPRLLRDYGGSRRLAGEVGEHLRFRVHGALGQLCAFVGANLSTWQNYDDAHAWYGAGLSHAERGGAREVKAWIAARSTLMAVHQDDPRQALEDAAYAVALSPPGQLGSTLGNALAAATLARVGRREAALAAFDDARRAVDRQPDVDTFTAYSLPWYRLGRFASETFTALGEFEVARRHQSLALPAYPPGSATDTTLLRLDAAEGAAREGHLVAAADALVEALELLSDEQRAPILLDRAVEVAHLLGPERVRAREAIRRRL